MLFLHSSKTKRTRPTDRTVDRVQSNFRKRTVISVRRRELSLLRTKTSYGPFLKHAVQEVLFSVNRTMSLDNGTRATHNTIFVPVGLKGRHRAWSGKQHERQVKNFRKILSRTQILFSVCGLLEKGSSQPCILATLQLHNSTEESTLASANRLVDTV